MPLTAPVCDPCFVLNHIVRISDLVRPARFAAVTSDIVDAVLEGVGQFASGEWAALARTGDTERARWTEEGHDAGRLCCGPTDPKQKMAGQRSAHRKNMAAISERPGHLTQRGASREAAMTIQ